MGTLTTDESALYRMSREDLATYGRAVQQYADAAARDLANFTVQVLGLPPDSTIVEVQRASAAAGLIPRAKEILAARLAANDYCRAYSETLRRRGLA